MLSRFMLPIDTTNNYSYVSKFMTKEEYLKKLGDVKMVLPENQVREGSFPDIYLPSTMGGIISIAEIAKCKNIVLFFYPGDKEGLKYPELAGCTPEACSFRDEIGALEQLNTRVFGVSFQTPQRQCQFVEEHHLNFPLLSDLDQILAKTLRMPYWISKQGDLYPCRQTYIIAKGNEVTKVFDKIEPTEHINEVLNEVKKLENLSELKW